MLTIEELAEVCGGRLARPRGRVCPSGFSIDSRTLRPGEFFIALPGRRTDGHGFLADAFAQGACGALVRAAALDAFPVGIGHNLIAVADTTSALQQAAHAYRDHFRIPLAAVTGSAGKTTTKELLAHLLGQAGWRVYRSPGNYNSEIGLPLALLNMPCDTGIGVFELALQRPGDIGQLAQILSPTLGIITNIGDAHLGFFRDCRELADAKWELIEALPPDGCAILNLDSSFLCERAGQAPCRVLGYAIDNSRAAVRASEIDDSSLNGLAFTLETPRGHWRVQTKLLGRPNIYTVLAAVAASEALGLDMAAVREALAGFNPVDHRLQLRRSPRFGWLLDDSYNASPQATREALQTLARLRVPDHQKVFVFGGMLELGPHSALAHREIAAAIAQLGVIDRFFGLGPLAAEVGQALLAEHGWPAERVALTERLDDLTKMVSCALSQPRNLVLVKGSRTLEFDRLVEALQAEPL